MAEIHVLNVGQGDCTILHSNSDRTTMFDICGGNIEQGELVEETIAKSLAKINFQMCKHPTNPIRFLKEEMGLSSVFRFILSHPDMDHLDGFNNLIENMSVVNFWDSGVRKEKPDFKTESKYKEEDWDRYVKVRDEKESGVNVVSPKAGAINKYYNQDDKGGGGDFIYIYAPDSGLVDEANDSENAQAVHDASYVIVYRSAGGRILLPGDAHDKAWDYVLKHYGKELKECEFMLAPHHGRDSNRSWTFLDKIKPKFSVLGCAASEHLAYNVWDSRKLKKITQNQAGNIAIYPDSDGLNIYVENKKFAHSLGGDTNKEDEYGNYYLTYIQKSTNY